MATRSRIIMRENDGSIISIYCHWDGYPANNGRILLDHYTDRDKVDELLGLGGISTLAPEIGEKHPFGKFEYDGDWDKKWDGWVTAYKRDRGEQDGDCVYHPSLEALRDSGDLEEYGYVFDHDDRWYVFGLDNIEGIKPLTQVIVSGEEEV